MDELVSVARRLRQVKEACREFLSRWAVERMKSSPAALDRLRADVELAGTDPAPRRPARQGSARADQNIAPGEALFLHRSRYPADEC